jgi:hypothetical protein
VRPWRECSDAVADLWDGRAPREVHFRSLLLISDFVPRDMDSVEKLIAQPGILQQYGRIR